MGQLQQIFGISDELLGFLIVKLICPVEVRLFLIFFVILRSQAVIDLGAGLVHSHISYRLLHDVLVQGDWEVTIFGGLNLGQVIQHDFVERPLG